MHALLLLFCILLVTNKSLLDHLSHLTPHQFYGIYHIFMLMPFPPSLCAADVRKELNFCQKTKVPVLGVVENMGFIHTSLSQMTFLDQQGKDATENVLKELNEKCPHIMDMVATSNLFRTNSESGAEKMATQYSVSYWGNLPLDNALLKCCEEGKAFVDVCPTSPVAKILTGFADRLVKTLPVNMADQAQGMKE